MNNDRILLSETIQRIDSAVSDIRDTVGGVTIEDVANNVTSKFIDQAESENDLYNLEGIEGKLAMVVDSGSDIVEWIMEPNDNATVSNLLIFPKKVVLEDTVKEETLYNIRINHPQFAEKLDQGIFTLDTSYASLALNYYPDTIHSFEVYVTYQLTSSNPVTYSRTGFTIRRNNVNYPIISDGVIFPFILNIYPDSSGQTGLENLGKFIKTRVQDVDFEVTTITNNLAFLTEQVEHIDVPSLEPASGYLVNLEGQDIGTITITGEDTSYMVALNIGGDQSNMEWQISGDSIGWEIIPFVTSLTASDCFVSDQAFGFRTDGSEEAFAILSLLLKTYKPSSCKLYKYTDGAWIKISDNWTLPYYQC